MLIAVAVPLPPLRGTLPPGEGIWRMEVGELSIVHCQLSIDPLFQVVDFFFQDGDAVGEVIVFPDFPG